MPSFEDTFIGRPETIRVYKSLFKTHIAPWHWEIPQGLVENLNWQPTANRFVKRWQDAGLSKKTVIVLLRLLRNYVKYESGVVMDVKPIQRSLERSEQQEELVVLNKEQASCLMDACQKLEPNFYPILLLGLHAGLRRGEVFGLRCGDIDALKGRIRVAHSYDGPTKNGKTRYVPMSAELSRVILGARNNSMRNVNERLFEILDPNPVLRRLCHAIHVAPMRFHDLRHTYATLALESGVSAKIVQTWLGHSNVSTTLNVYWNLSKAEADVNLFLPGAK